MACGAGNSSASSTSDTSAALPSDPPIFLLGGNVAAIRRRLLDTSPSMDEGVDNPDEAGSSGPQLYTDETIQVRAWAFTCGTCCV